MNDHDPRTVRRRLVARRRLIMARYDGVMDLGDRWIKLLSDDDARTLLAVFEAMRRNDVGTYGICLGCGGIIDLTRLNAQPEAAICIVCAMFAAAPLEAVA